MVVIDEIVETSASAIQRIFCLPKNYYVNPGECCCCNHPLQNSPIAPWTCFLAWPVGGFLGLVFGWYGFNMFQHGIFDINKAMDSLRIKVEIGGDDFLPIIQNQGILVVLVLCDLAVCVYGLREKLRTRFNQLPHIPSCPAAGVKCLVKTLIHFLVVVSVLVMFVFVIIAEALFIALLVADEACKLGSDAVKNLIDIFNQNQLLDDNLDDAALQEDIDEICRDVRHSKTASIDAIIGSGLAIIGQAIILAYWMKYSTLGLAVPFELSDVYGQTKRMETVQINVDEVRTMESQSSSPAE